MKKLLLLLLPLIFLFSTNIRAQNEQDEFIVSGKDTIVPLNEGRFIFNDRIYKENSPYFTMAYGAGWNLGHGAIEQNMTLSYHHFIKKTGLAIGYHSSSDNKIWWRSYQKLNDLFLLAGIRHETVRYNFSAFAGPTLAYGSYIKYSEELEQNMAHGFTTLGGVFEGTSYLSSAI